MNKLNYHFIGICGISMSALALYLKSQGHNVQGSDIAKNDISNFLESNGIKVFFKHSKQNLGDCDVVVYNYAIKQNNPEYIESKKRKIKIISRAKLLGEISS